MITEARIHRLHARMHQVFVRTLSGRSVALAVDEAATVDTVKALLQRTQGVPVHLQRLQFAGQTPATVARHL